MHVIPPHLPECLLIIAFHHLAERGIEPALKPRPQPTVPIDALIRLFSS